MQAHKLEERWTPTTIHVTFALRGQPSYCTTTSSGISIHLPLLSLGWTFALSLVPELVRETNYNGQWGGPTGGFVTKQSTSYKWTSTAFSFRQHDSKIPWGNTSMHAQLSLLTEQHDCGDIPPVYDEDCTPQNNIGSDSIGTIKVVLAHTPSVKLPLATSYTLSSHRPTKVRLTVTIQECPFPNGLFQASSNNSSETEAQTQLVKQSGDRVLTRSLTTGKLFDVKFLSFSTPSTSGNFGKLLPTYASLSVLEKHVNISDAKLREEWTSALAALNDHDNASSKHVKEILCPNDDEYELDSDYEDEEEASSPVEPGASSLPCERNLVVILEGKQPESSTARSRGSWSSFEVDGASDQNSVDYQPEEVIKGPGGPPRLSSVATADCERTVLVKFAAHRTWHAFLWYCYTGHVEFNRLKSQVEPGVRRLPLTNLMDGPPSCSPKSMYRLADLVGKKDLKAKALQAIGERMTKANVLDEMFSVFTSKYPDVRKAQLSALKKHCGSPEVKKAFLKTISKYSSMPHAEPVLSAFYDRFVA